ncbi:hypothetical protein SAMN05661103_4397 [Agrobacterium sp. 719_389]|nr:hypothetical protein SAMN05661103_4397 [Agrobacterium sp. 719_389]
MPKCQDWYIEDRRELDSRSFEPRVKLTALNER